MPTYDYKCNACSHRFEQFQSMKDKTLRKCPKCGKGALERLIGIGAAVIFKGSGFYQTDYRSEAYKKSADSDKKAETPAAGGEKTKTEGATPGATKTESAPKTEPAKAAQPAKPSAEGKPKKSQKKRG
jgi:putative FmdB family regulatory protein